VAVIVQVLVTGQFFGICPTKKENTCLNPRLYNASFTNVPLTPGVSENE